VTVQNSYPLPNIQETLESLNGTQWFSVLDLQSGFWQVPVKESDKHKTAFTTGHRLFEFERMAYGMTNSPSTFACLMDKVLQGLHWEVCLLYIDDVLIMAKTWEELLQRQNIVFQRLRVSNLKLKPSKCKFGLTSVPFLGHIVSRNGIEADPEKLRAIRDIPSPTTQKQVRSFLGLASYYRKFVPTFANIAKPLHILTKKDETFSWTHPHVNRLFFN
jgi:hypothetical protein